MKRCPKCGNNSFIVSPHVVQSWEVDEYGNWLNTIEECVEIAHEADDYDQWTCTKCHYEDAGYKFES